MKEQQAQALGIHLHLEMQDISEHSWIFGADKSYYTNPATFMGIPNEEGISVFYDGIPIPIYKPRKQKFKWVLYANKLRKRSNKFTNFRI